MKIGFIGAGRVGCSLGRYFSENGAELSGYYSRSSRSAQEAAEFTASAAFDDMESLIAASDAVFITVPDGSIRAVYNTVAGLISGKLICHCSGAMSARDAFPDIEERGAEGYSVHPLFPVSSRFEAYRGLKTAFFCIEGDSRHIDMWRSLLEGAGNPVKVISADVKSRYHAACAVSSNLVCALVDESVSLLTACGFSEDEAYAALRPLALSNIERIFEVGAKDALTGPVDRNDIGTVKKHLGCIPDAEMYRAVSRRLTELAQRKNPDTDYSDMTELLGK